jgi:hypothetical protein
LQHEMRSAAAARSTATDAIVLKRREREELVVAAAASSEIAEKGSAAAAVVASALHRAQVLLPLASAAEFRAAAAAAAEVGHVIVATAPHDNAISACDVPPASCAGNGELRLCVGFHGDPMRQHCFWQYCEGTALQNKRWETDDAASFCSNSGIASTLQRMLNPNLLLLS